MNQEIRQALSDWNPWWQGEFPEKLLGIKRDYDLAPYLEVPEIKILEGARRVGKSTLMYQVIKRVLSGNEHVLYINFEDEILRKYSLAEIVYEHLEYARIDYLFVDEIQICKDWVQFVRKVHDRKEFSQIWISGSNATLIKEEYATLLTGRNFPIHIAPLSFTEFTVFKDVKTTDIDYSRNSVVKLLTLFNEYMEHGAFPAVVTRSVLKKELLLAYFDDFIYKDIVARYNVNPQKIKELAIYLATNSARIFSYRNIATVLQCHPNTINDYFSHLKNAFLFAELYKYDYSLKSQLAHDRKVYCLDTGLAAAVSFRFSQDQGSILENIVFCALQHKKHELYFHKHKHECDFIIKQELHITAAIQVCVSLSDPDTKAREFNGLLDAMQQYKLSEGLILTYNEEAEESFELDGNSYKIKIMPVWKWMLGFSPHTHKVRNDSV